MVPIDIDDEVHTAIQAATVGGEHPNQVLRRLLGLPPTDQDAATRPEGELAGLVAAGLIAPGERVFLTATTPRPHPVATVTSSGRLQAPNATVYPGPRQLLGALRGEKFEPYGWACLTITYGTRLEALRQRHLAETAPHLLPHGPGSLTPLIAAGLLEPGDELRLTLPRRVNDRIDSPVVGVATVTEDGCFLLPDGDRYLDATGAGAAYRGNPFSTFGSWLAPNGRRLASLRQLARTTEHH
jgi:hypothetical protein